MGIVATALPPVSVSLTLERFLAISSLKCSRRVCSAVTFQAIARIAVMSLARAWDWIKPNNIVAATARAMKTRAGWTDSEHDRLRDA